MEIIKLKSRLRTGAGKSYTRKIRREGWVPAVYYGQSMEPLSIEVDKREFAAIVRNKRVTRLFDLGLAGGQETSIAVIREVQRHVLKNDLFFHVDFQHVAMDKKIIVDVPIELTGIATGVKDSGGVLGHPVKRLKIECMPAEIPEKISVEISHLEIGDSIHVRDLSIPNVTIKASPDEVIAVVTHPTREEEVAKPVEEVAVEAAASAATEGTAPGAAPKGGTAPPAGGAAPKGK